LSRAQQQDRRPELCRERKQVPRQGRHRRISCGEDSKRRFWCLGQCSDAAARPPVGRGCRTARQVDSARRESAVSSTNERRVGMNHQRRGALKTGGGLGIFGMLVAAGLVKPGSALARDQKVFDAKTIDEAFAAMGAGKPEASDGVTIVAPDIAENGAVVPVGVTSSLDKIESISILVEKNPNMVAANFLLPEGTMADVQTRIKMGQTSDVYAVVKADGKYFMAKKEIKVTLGGCGG